jgi:hypothetical protein
MRFSSLFPKPSPQREPRGTAALRENPRPTASPPKDLPEELDARVRLIGEWQQLES